MMSSRRSPKLYWIKSIHKTLGLEVRLLFLSRVSHLCVSPISTFTFPPVHLTHILVTPLYPNLYILPVHLYYYLIAKVEVYGKMTR
jgi:hypothetical protein